MIGRLRHDVANLPNGFDSFLIRTATKGLGQLTGYDEHILGRIDATTHALILIHKITFCLILSFSVMHNIKVNRNLFEMPSIDCNDLVYVSGEIAYERIISGAEKISIPQIFARKVHRLENNSDPTNLEQLHKGEMENVVCVEF